MKKTITIFGSSKPADNEEQYLTAYSLGKHLAQNGFNICTGGFNGIMEAASKGAVEGGAEAIGVTVNLWSSKANKYLSEEIICETLFERIDKLIELGHGYVILQGGTGTLLELAAVWEYSNKGLSDQKPVACHSKIWKVIVSEMNQQMKLEGRNFDMVKTFETIEEIVEHLKSKL
jgi:uncharacterized protein (TIGR00730 family)